MQFHGLSFLFLFLPLFLLAYYGAGRRWQNGILLLLSGVYYGLLGGWWNLGVILLFVALTYFLCRLMGVLSRKWLLFGGLTVIFGGLLFFKTAGGGRFLMPGFSFVSFQLAACLFRVYQKIMEPERDFLSFSAQILMFPKLLAGPLTEPQELQRQMRSRKAEPEQIHDGLQTFLLGLGLKVLLADPVGGIWAQARVAGFGNISPVFAWLALVSFAMALYFDFYGYSVMARGLGTMLGFQLPKNFDTPYLALSVGEFYRRWHRSLSLWLREYVYIPLGGSRAGKTRTAVNILLVWLFSGLWHGVGGNYLVWALFLGGMMVLERFWLGKYLKRKPAFAHIYTVLVILLSWVPFGMENWKEMGIFLGKLFCLGGKASNPLDFLLVLKSYFWYLFAGAFLAFTDCKPLWEKLKAHRLGNWAFFALFWLCVSRIATAAQSTFAYFQF